MVEHSHFENVAVIYAKCEWVAVVFSFCEWVEEEGWSNKKCLKLRGKGSEREE